MTKNGKKEEVKNKKQKIETPPTETIPPPTNTISPPETTPEIIKEEPEEKPKFELAGMDISEFRAKPIDSNIVIKKEVTNIPVKKPNGQQFFRIHPDLEFTADCIKWKEDNDRLYLLHPSMVPILQEQSLKFILHVGMYLTSKTIFLFPVQQPKPNEKWNTWHEGQAESVSKAKTQWIRMEPSREQGGYILHKAQGMLDDPDWPDKTMEEYLTIAFKSTNIIDETHPIVKQLRGL